MFSFFEFTCRFKRGMLEITSNLSNDTLEKYLDPLQNFRLQENICFEVVAGKKKYDIIGLRDSWLEFYSQRVIDTLSIFEDMSGKCYPIHINNIDESYYVINNLPAFSFLNKDELLSMYEPRYYDIQQESCPSIFGIHETDCIMVSECIKNALLKNKISNIELRERFGCTQEEYDKIKRMKFQPEVHVFRDK